jgi:O-acetyl-ADP-ribose deacetylase (regulator of RNase III)
MVIKEKNMITYFDGTVFNTPAKAIVNTVNCVGTMGKGLALEFKLRYPDMYEEYKKQCEIKEIKIGKIKLYEESENLWIMNFPTKMHWRNPSKMEYIEAGLKYFVKNYKKINIESIAFPKLGSNNGGLKWEDVKVLMEKYLNDLDIDVYICLDKKREPEGKEKEMLDSIINADF